MVQPFSRIVEASLERPCEVKAADVARCEACFSCAHSTIEIYFPVPGTTFSVTRMGLLFKCEEALYLILEGRDLKMRRTKRFPARYINKFCQIQLGGWACSMCNGYNEFTTPSHQKCAFSSSIET